MIDLHKDNVSQYAANFYVIIQSIKVLQNSVLNF